MRPENQRSLLASVLITLFKGVLYEDHGPDLWGGLAHLQVRVRDYVSVLGLELVLDEAEGYAYLRQRAGAEQEGEQVPRLVQRRQLGYVTSLLLALIRKKLAEHDATGGDTRLILSRDEIVDLVQVFLPAGANEAKMRDRLDGDISRIIEMGFLRRLRGHDDQFEVRRILKAFVDAQWLADFEQRLAAYRTYAAARPDGRGD